ncbi:hypothetical protein [Legionella yabuuchiae]|uniref:hypothetical protein n=1 Tax=Legionella yabuuchiae TaxID=376727 RepID=UPI001055AA5F|nr:hypothetical protein [Legionella yabuuchiae]
MKKPNDLNELYTLLDAEPTGNPNHYLFLLGTDTKFTSKPSPVGVKEYVRGETLSYAAQVAATVMGEVGEEGEQESALSFSSESVDVLNGPTTFGAEVGQRIAQAVFLALRAVASGKTTLELSAHSRGAVEAILVMHELKRIKEALRTQPEKTLYNILLETPSNRTKTAFQFFFHASPDSAEDNIDRRTTLGERLSHLKINAFLIDPVPGDTRFALPTFGWHDPRFYLEPPADKVQLILSRDERTHCFIPIIPAGVHPMVLPGHHGTASGNLFSQRYQNLPETIEKRDTYHVQELVLCKLLQFFHQTSATTEFDLPGEFDLHHPDLDRVVHEFLILPEQKRPGYMLDLYEKIQQNNDAYAWFQTSSYPYLGLTDINGQRYIHLRSQDYHSMAALTPAMNGDIVNTEHAALVVKRVIDIPNIQETEPRVIVTAINNALTEVIAQMKEPDGIEPSPLRRLFSNKDLPELFFEALSNLVDSVGQKYLSNHLTEEEKIRLLEILKAPFTTLTKGIEDLGIDEDVNKNILKRCQEILQTGVKRTVESHYHNILEQAKKIDDQITLSIQYSEPSQVIETFQQTLANDPDFNELHTALDSSEKTPEVVQTLLTQEFERISGSTQSDESKEALTNRLIQYSSLLNQYQDAKDCSTEQYLQILEELHHKALSLKSNHPELNKLVGDQPLELNPYQLELCSTRILMLAGKFLKEQNYNLSVIPQGVGGVFFELIKPLAIALGAPSPEALDRIQRLQSVELENVTLEARLAILNQEKEALQQHSNDLNVALEEQLEILNREKEAMQQRSQALSGRFETRCGALIHDKLLVLTEQYLHHLWLKAKKFNSSLPANPDFKQPLPDIAADASQADCYNKIKEKFDAVYNMKLGLENVDLKPSERIQNFMTSLRDNEVRLKTHRDASWKQFVKSSLAVIAIIITGIIPGLIGLGAYSLATGRSPLFFAQSKGKHFVEDCRQVPIPAPS